MSPRAKTPNWKERLEGRFLTVVGSVVVGTAAITSAVWFYFSGQYEKLAETRAATELATTKQADAVALEKTRKELQAKIDDLEAHLLLVRRHLESESSWNVKAAMLTPGELEALDKAYVYYAEVHCFLSVPASDSWKLSKTTEKGLMQMMYGPGMDLTNPQLTEEERTGLGTAEKLHMDLWKGPGSFDIDIGDPQFPKLHVFPYVFIEELNDEGLAQATGQSRAKASEEAKSQALEHLEHALKTTDRGADHSEETRQALNEFFDADSAGFLMGSLIRAGFEQASKVTGSTFCVLDAQKTANVFYLHVQNVFAASGESPEIRWDREYIWLGCKKTNLLIATSIPWSPNSRFTETWWINVWLTSLRVALDL